MKGTPARLEGSLTSKPTWSNTSGCSATSAFFMGTPTAEKIAHENGGFYHAGFDQEMPGSGRGQRSGRLQRPAQVTVLGIDHGKVRLGFEAAEDVPVHRLEVWERIRANASLDGPTKNSQSLASSNHP
jgi:carbon storage regulator CsrA